MQTKNTRYIIACFLFAYVQHAWYYAYMNTITIPKNLAKDDDLVIIPRREYKSLLELKKIIPIVNATKKEVAVIKRGEKEIKRGEYVVWDKLKNGLANSRN